MSDRFFRLGAAIVIFTLGFYAGHLRGRVDVAQFQAMQFGVEAATARLEQGRKLMELQSERLSECVAALPGINGTAGSVHLSPGESTVIDAIRRTRGGIWGWGDKNCVMAVDPLGENAH